MSKRSPLYLLWFSAALGWGGLLLFTRFIPPRTVVAYGAFFVIFGIALLSTLAPLAYFIELRIFPKQHYRMLARYALRQGSLLTGAALLNLIFLALHSWNIIMALITIAAAVVIEVLFLARK